MQLERITLLPKEQHGMCAIISIYCEPTEQPEMTMPLLSAVPQYFLRLKMSRLPLRRMKVREGEPGIISSDHIKNTLQHRKSSVLALLTVYMV